MYTSKIPFTSGDVYSCRKKTPMAAAKGRHQTAPSVYPHVPRGPQRGFSEFSPVSFFFSQERSNKNQSYKQNKNVLIYNIHIIIYIYNIFLNIYIKMINLYIYDIQLHCIQI